MEIEINSELTRKVGEDMHSNIENFASKIALISSDIDLMESAWTGNDANNYISGMRRNIEDLQTLMEILYEYANYVKNVPTTYEILDEIYSSKGIDI